MVNFQNRSKIPPLMREQLKIRLTNNSDTTEIPL